MYGGYWKKEGRPWKYNNFIAETSMGNDAQEVESVVSMSVSKMAASPRRSILSLLSQPDDVKFGLPTAGLMS